jgi:hypothetical protein
LFKLAEKHKGLVASSGVLSVMASAASFVPYLAVYFLIRELIVPAVANLRFDDVLVGRIRALRRLGRSIASAGSATRAAKMWME